MVYLLLAPLFLFTLYLLFFNPNKNAISKKKYAFIAFVICVSAFSFDKISEREAWKNTEFNGQVTRKIKTDNHGLIEFTIAQADGEIAVIDKFSLMTAVEIGDHISKNKGTISVLIIKLREMGSGENGT